MVLWLNSLEHTRTRSLLKNEGFESYRFVYRRYDEVSRKSLVLSIKISPRGIKCPSVRQLRLLRGALIKGTFATIFLSVFVPLGKSLPGGISGNFISHGRKAPARARTLSRVRALIFSGLLFFPSPSPICAMYFVSLWFSTFNGTYLIQPSYAVGETVKSKFAIWHNIDLASWAA